MSQPASNYTPPPPPNYGTSLVDRTNIAVYLRRYLKLFLRRGWILVFCVLSALGLSVYKAKHTPDIYVASSKLVIKPKTETGVGSVRIKEDDFNETQLLYIKSEPVLKEVTKEMLAHQPKPGPVPKLPHPPKAEHGLGSTFLLTVESTDFDYSRRYVQTWVNEFLKFKTNLLNQVMTNKSSATRLQVASQESELRDVERQTDELLRTNGIVSLNDLTSPENLYNKFNTEFQDLTDTIFRLKSATREQLATEGLLKTPQNPSDKPTGPKGSKAEPENPDPLGKFSSGSGYTRLMLELKSKTNELARLSEVYLPKHPEYVRLEREILTTRNDINHQLDILDDERKARIESLELSAKTYPRLIAEKKIEAVQLAKVKLDYERLKERDVRIKVTLDQLNRELRGIELSSASEEEFYPLENGIGNGEPIFDRSRIIVTGLLIGWMIGLSIVYFLHRLDDRLELAEDIEEELEEPVLGQIPQLEKKLLKDGLLLVSQLEPHSMYAEAIRGVRSAVMFGNKGTPKQTIMVTSALPGDGKTSFTVNFAITLANAGQRVLLVDADLRRGTTGNYFTLPQDHGLTEILAGDEHWADVLTTTPIDHLSLISPGRLPSNPGELLLSPVMREFIEEARPHFDHIIIDCPPLTAIDDTFSLLGIADGVLFVIRSGQTSIRFAKSGIAAMRQRGAQILGVVLNGLTADNPAYYYARYYHAYYTKGLPTGSSQYAPAKKMASPRSKRYEISSIEKQAQARAGHHSSLHSVTKEDQHKAEVFKARRVAQNQPAGAT
jgi:polysaccharide biosynthesis transport protein